jgi:hypothetical protein
MVFDTSTVGQAKKERTKAKGKLIGIQSDSSKCKIFDPEVGRYSWLRLSIVTGQDKDGKDEFLNVTAYDLEFDVMPELKRADALLREGKKPEVELQHYVTTKVATDDKGNPVLEDNKPKIYINNRMSRDDMIKTFKILKDHFDEVPADDSDMQDEIPIVDIKGD